MPYAGLPRATPHMLVGGSVNNCDVIYVLVILFMKKSDVKLWRMPAKYQEGCWGHGSSSVGDRARVHSTPRVRVTVHYALGALFC